MSEGKRFALACTHQEVRLNLPLTTNIFAPAGRVHPKRIHLTRSTDDMSRTHMHAVTRVLRVVLSYNVHLL